MNLMLVGKLKYRKSVVAHTFSSVVGLFSAGGPTNISRFIASRVIHSVNTVFRRWGIFDVGVKCFKIVTPVFEHCYAFRPVVFKGAVRWIMAPSFYVAPRCVDFGVGHAMRKVRLPSGFSAFSDSIHAFFLAFSPVTSAGNSVACSEVFSFYPNSVSAFALAEPIKSFFSTEAASSGFTWTDDEQSSGSLSYSIYSLSHP